MSSSPATPAAVAHQATTEALWERAAVIAGQLNRAHGALVEVAAGLIEGGHWGDGGFRSPEHWLVVRAGLSPARATEVVLIARRRDELPDTADALATGELSVDQAAVLARHARADHQAGMARFARSATVPQLRHALSKSVFVDSDAPDEAADQAAARPDLTMHYDSVGRFHLRYSAAAEVGALVEQAVKEAKDALFTAARGETSVGPSYADALAEMAQRSLASIESTNRAAHYRVYVHLSTEGAWVSGGGAITPAMARRFSCDGIVQPLWETQGRPVSVGRDQRIVPARTRRLIEDRDRGCRFPGCSATKFVEIHHLDHWADGGATDYDRQVSLCPFHHDAHHRGDVTIAGDPTQPGRLRVTNRYGLRIRPPDRAELATGAQRDADPKGSPPYASPSGGPMRTRDVEFVPDDRPLRASSP
jgi:hypothetical protein